MWSATTWLIVLCVVVFALSRIFYAQIMQGNREIARVSVINAIGAFSISKAILGGQVWRFITFQFLHANWMHLVMNMLGLYLFGPVIENALGRRRYLAFYLLCGMAGAVGYMLLWAWGNTTGIELLRAARYPLIGASAGVYGVLMATARLAPNATVLVMGLIPARLREVALFMLAVSAITAFISGPNAGGEAAHLGGAVLGWLLIGNPRWLNIFGGRSGRPSRPATDR
jgi:membrane associated rhomboid family serine protease